MSLQNIISFGAYTPPAPKTINNSAPALVKDYTMSNGDIARYMIRNNLIQITATFQLTANQLEDFDNAVKTGEEIRVTYKGDTYFMLLTAYTENDKNFRRNGNYEISITLKESRR